MNSKSGARAFLEATAKVIATRDKGDGNATHKCRTDWKLHIAGTGESTSHQSVVYSYTEPEFTQQFGGDSSLYFGGGVLQWSTDGNLLLAQAQVGGYEDWFKLTSIVYRLSDNKSWATDLTGLLTKQQRVSSEACALAARIVGFASDNRVLVEAEPFEWVEPRGCFPKSTWLIDFEAGKAERLFTARK